LLFVSFCSPKAIITFKLIQTILKNNSNIVIVIDLDFFVSFASLKTQMRNYFIAYISLTKTLSLLNIYLIDFFVPTFLLKTRFVFLRDKQYLNANKIILIKIEILMYSHLCV